MRRMISCILSALLVLAGGAAAHVHTTIVSGTVFGRNGRPVMGAAVIIERSDGSAPLATRTNVDGRFVFKFVRSGYYDIRASQAGASTTWRHNVLVHAGKDTSINLRLEPVRRKTSK